MAVSWSFAQRVSPDSKSGIREGDILRAGQRFGPYEVLEPLGTGGTSRVYRARGPEGECALKILKATLGEEMRERFRREGVLASALSHPGIVRLLDGGEIEGVPYLAYELVPGGLSLLDQLARVDLRGRVRLLRTLSEAVGHAHRRGIVHRDLKPANVLVEADGTVKVTDFGLGVGGDLERMTQSGTLVGTPRYMSPEQLQGRRDLGPASDVWSLGILLYLALTGRHPFQAEGLVKLREQVTTRSPASPAALNPALPRPLVQVIGRALSREPGARYAHAEALAEALIAVEGQVPDVRGPNLPQARRPASSTVRLPFPLGSHEPFELIEVLGRGAMGVVYRARDRGLEREVAVKAVLGARGARREERFRREGEVTANLHHENILKVHGIGSLLEIPYLIYELVPGAKTLDEVTPDLDRRGKLALLRDAARGLGYAHQHGVIHRDVKPDNLLVGDDGRVRVADFGLAAMQGLERLTRTGALVGTPQFMSPEQMTGDRERVGAPSDVWALGVILFRMLTGELPFPSGTLVELAAAVTSATESPSPRAVDPELPAALDAICRRALEPSPADRYPDAAQFAADLDAFLEGRRPLASQGSGWAGVTRKLHRKPLLLLGGLAVASLGGALLVSARGLSAERVPASPTAATSTPELDPATLAPRAWSDAQALQDPRQQVAAVVAFRQAYPEHPRAEDARAFLAERRYGYRVAVLEHGLKGKWVKISAAFQGDEIVTVGSDERLLRWNSRFKRLSKRALPFFPHGNSGGQAGVDAIASWVGGVVICGGVGPMVRIPNEGEVFEDERVHALDADLAPTGDRMVVGTRGGEVVVISLQDSSVASPLGQMRYPVQVVEYSPGGRYVVAASVGDKDLTGLAASEIALWELSSGERLFREPSHWIPRSVAFLPDESAVFVGDSTGRAALYDSRTGREVPGGMLDGRSEKEGLRAPFAHRGSVKAMVMENRRGVLYTCGKDGTHPGMRGTLRIWNAATRELLRPEITLKGEPEQAEISADGTLLLISTEGGGAELWAIDLVEVD